VAPYIINEKVKKNVLILSLLKFAMILIPAPSMSSSMEILARQVVGYHFCHLVLIL
jgi:hypothetical protein